MKAPLRVGKRSRMGWCCDCGVSLWTNTPRHRCSPPEASLPCLDTSVMAALVQAENALCGNHPEPSRALATLRRALWRFQLDASSRQFFSIQSTADVCPPSQ